MQFDVLLYDVTSTYFEGEAKASAKAARGYPRDQRPDCQQVNIGVGGHARRTAHRLRSVCRHTTDVTTVEDMVGLMEQKYGQAQRIWVLDRGMISEDSIDFLRQRHAPVSGRRRVEAHILVCFLSLALWCTLEMWMRGKGLRDARANCYGANLLRNEL